MDEKKSVLLDLAVKKEHYKLEKSLDLREQLERTWKAKRTVVPVVIGALGAVTAKLEEQLQQILGTTSEISVQNSTVFEFQRYSYSRYSKFNLILYFSFNSMYYFTNSLVSS